MPKEIIHLDKSSVGELHCDNPRCSYISPQGTLQWGEHLIGTPCPKCDSNLLTRKDYEATERMFALVAKINKWFGWLGKEYDPADKKSWPSKVGVRHHDGKVTFDTKE